MEKLAVREGADDDFEPRRADCSGIRGQSEHDSKVPHHYLPI